MGETDQLNAWGSDAGRIAYPRLVVDHWLRHW
jgi:hypothetical protein